MVPEKKLSERKQESFHKRISFSLTVSIVMQWEEPLRNTIMWKRIALTATFEVATTPAQAIGAWGSSRRTRLGQKKRREKERDKKVKQLLSLLRGRRMHVEGGGCRSRVNSFSEEKQKTAGLLLL